MCRIQRETLARMATRRNLMVAVCLVTVSHMLAQASSPSSEAAANNNQQDQATAKSKKVKILTVEMEKRSDKGEKMSMVEAPDVDISMPKHKSAELMVPNMEMDIVEMKSMPMMPPVPMMMEEPKQKRHVSMMMVPVVKVKDHSKMVEDLNEAAGHKKYMLVKKKPKMKKIKMEVYKPKMKYKKIKMKVPVKKMKKKKVKGYMVKKHHEHY